jgi:hypothetical protein
MGKNFDEARAQRAEQSRDERQFTLGGESFHAKATVRPEVLTAFDGITEQTPLPETLAIADDTVLAMIEDDPDENGVGGHERYRRLRARDEDPVGAADLLDLCEWLVGVATGRPTSPPSASSNGPGGTGTSSTAASSSPVEPAPTPST